MNKITSLKRAVLVAVALGAAGATAVFADTATTAATSTTTPTTTTGTPGEGWHHRHHHGGVLSAAERAQLKKDREAAFAANPALKTQHDNLKQQFQTLKSQSTPATQAQWDALKTQRQAFETQLRSAIEGIDSGASALFQKIDAAKAAHHHAQ